MNREIIKLFVDENNMIEGVDRDPYEDEITAVYNFMDLPVISILDLEIFVDVIQPGAVLRDKPGVDVRVGNYYPPKGGPEIRTSLADLLLHSDIPPWHLHMKYESLHPFTDGNGRSGRMLWAWRMGEEFFEPCQDKSLGFLHSFYYQTLRMYSKFEDFQRENR